GRTTAVLVGVCFASVNGCVGLDAPHGAPETVIDAIPGLGGWEYQGAPAPIPGLEVVATGPTRSPHGTGTLSATVYPGPRGDVVLSSARCWWSHGLAWPPGYSPPLTYRDVPLGPDPRAQRITANVLDRMRRVGNAACSSSGSKGAPR